MLINLSNHPVDKWSLKQKNDAQELYGIVIDLKFPEINPEATKDKVIDIVEDYFLKITLIFDECANNPFPNAVHIQGEFTFVCNMVNMLKSSGIKCIASTTMRNVIEKSSGEKIVKFDFVNFREY
jgi:hypothetical protein